MDPPKASGVESPRFFPALRGYPIVLARRVLDNSTVRPSRFPWPVGAEEAVRLPAHAKARKTIPEPPDSSGELHRPGRTPAQPIVLELQHRIGGEGLLLWCRRLRQKVRQEPVRSFQSVDAVETDRAQHPQLGGGHDSAQICQVAPDPGRRFGRSGAGVANLAGRRQRISERCRNRATSISRLVELARPVTWFALLTLGSPWRNQRDQETSKKKTMASSAPDVWEDYRFTSGSTPGPCPHCPAHRRSTPPA